MTRIARSITSGLALTAIISATAVAQGNTAEVTIPARGNSAGRHGWVYTPVGYPASCASGCNLIVAFDGAMYLGAMPLPEILDSLVYGKRIPPTVALLFDNGAPPERISDLANSAEFARFVAEEMIPWVREHYKVTRAADRTIVTGSSAGGLGAAYVALKYPALFGNVLSQSGAFWRPNEGTVAPPYEWLTSEYESRPKAPIRFFIDVGRKETGGAMGGTAPSLLDANRHLLAVLRKVGYSVDYFEVPDGMHSPDTWRKRLPAGIVALFGSK